MSRTLVVWGLVLGCGGGGGGGTPNDAASDTPIDVAIDGSSTSGVCPPDPTSGQLVHVTLGRANVDVIWSNPDGSLRGCTKTDATGKTQLLVESAGSAVTWVMPLSNGSLLSTVMGVKPGDNIGSVGVATGTPPAIRVTYASAVTNATGYMFDLGCAGTSYGGSSGFNPSLTPSDFNYFPLCVASDGTHANLYAEARDSSSTVLRYATASNVTLTPPLTQVTMGAWRTDFVDAPVTLTNLPFAVQNQDVLVGWNTAGVDFNDSLYRLTGGVAAMGATTMFPGRKLPMGLADKMIATIRLQQASTGYFHYFSVESSGAVGARSFNVSNALPFPTSIVDDFAAKPPRPTITWQADATLLATDAMQLRVRYQTNAGDNTWNVIGPADQPSFRFPELPDTLADLRPIDPYDRRMFYLDNDALTVYANVDTFPVQARGRYVSLQF